jgi:hypothetical protein
MVKASSKKRSSSKYDVIVKAKATTTRIVDINNEIVRFECNDKGQVTGKHYSGVHWDTVESTMLADGSATMTIRYLHMTQKRRIYCRSWNWNPDGSKSKRNCESYW